MRLRSLLLCTAAAASLALGSFACSSDKASPPPVDVDKDGGKLDAGASATDASDAAASDASDAAAQVGVPADIAHASTLCGAVVCGIMGVAKSGFQEIADVGFLVKDKDGKPVTGATVTFSLEGAPPGTALLGTTAVTNEKGIATGRVQSGATLGVFTVRAAVTESITAQSPAIGVRGVTPSNRGSSIQCNLKNLGAYVDPLPPKPLQTECSIKLVDRFNNPVGKGTTVNLKTEAGAIPSSVQSTPFAATGANDAEGTAKVVFSTVGTFPPVDTTAFAGEATGTGGNQRDALVTVLAYVSGEEAYDDNNANGTWDTGENFIDQGEPFVDANDNNVWDPGEFYADLPDPVTKMANGKYDGPNGKWDRETTIWMVTYIVYSGVVSNFKVDPVFPGSFLLNSNAAFDVLGADERFNPPQAGAVTAFSFGRLAAFGSATATASPILDGYAFGINRALFSSADPAIPCNASLPSCVWLTKFNFAVSPYTLGMKLVVKGATSANAGGSDVFTLSATTHANKVDKTYNVFFQ